jgi:hypothetical protein
MAKEKVKRTRSIITGHLEKIGSNVFDNYSSVIKELIKGNQGINGHISAFTLSVRKTT